MVIVIISILIAIALFFYLKKIDFVDKDYSKGGFVFYMIYMPILLTLILHALTFPIKLERPTVVTTQKIVAMKPDSKIEGEMSGGLFFYRCRINEIDYYVYLTESNEVYKQENAPVNQTVIKETEDQPRIVKTTHIVRNGLPNIIRFKLKCDYNEVIDESYVIFVPKGTISECSKYVVF